MPSDPGLISSPTSSCPQADDATEQVDYCAVAGLTRTTAAEPGLCRNTLLPYVEQFCATPVDKLGGKNELEISYNLFMCE